MSDNLHGRNKPYHQQPHQKKYSTTTIMSHPLEKTQRTATPLVFSNFGRRLFFQSFCCHSRNVHHERTNLTDQPHNHPRMLGHENSPCEWVTSHLSEDMGYVVSSMGVFGDACTNNNELKSCSETQSNTTEPHPTSCKLQRDVSTCSSYELHTNLCSINLASHNTPTDVPNDDTHTIPFTLTAGASVKRGIFVPFL